MSKEFDWLEVALSVSGALYYTDATGVYGEDEVLLAYPANDAMNAAVHQLYRFELAARNEPDCRPYMSKLDEDAPNIEWQR